LSCEAERIELTAPAAQVCGLDPVRPFDLSDTIYSPFIVSSIEAVDLDFDENGNRCFRFFATQAGSGSNNPGTHKLTGHYFLAHFGQSQRTPRGKLVVGAVT